MSPKPQHRVRLDISYRGDNYRGWATNPGVPTIEETLQSEIERIVRVPVRLDVAGRTDSGVHAAGQVVSFDVPDGGVDPGPLQLALNKLLPADLVVTAASKVSTDFHARFSAVARRYRYRLLNAPLRDPLRLGVVWHVPEPLDRAAMDAGGSVLLATTTSRRSAVARRTLRRPRWCGVSPTWSSWRPVTNCGSRSKRTRSAIRWCAQSSVCSSTSGSPEGRWRR